MMYQYYIIENEQQAGPFSKADLSARHISSETLVWRQGLNDWVKASTLPELADIIAIETGYEDLNTGEDSRWFAILNDKQTGPYTIETLVSMGLNGETPVWRAGMTDWAKASTMPEFARHLSATPPPHQSPYSNPNPGYGQPNFGQNPQYGQNPYGYRQNQAFNNPFSNRQYSQNGYNNSWNNTSMPRTNWLPIAIVATIVGFMFSCIGAIFGIIGIVNANNANNYYATGYDEMGDRANNTAKTMTIIAFVLAGLGLIGTLFFYRGSWF